MTDHRAKFDHDKYLTDSEISNDLVNELTTNPSLLAYYSAQAAYWSKVTDAAKAAYKARRAEVVLDAKRDEPKTPAVTLEAMQDADTEAKKLYSQHLAAKEQYDLYSHAVDTLSQKQYSLGSLNWREKREQEITSAPLSRSTTEEKAERRADLLAKLG